MNWLWVGIGSFLGGVMRYGVGTLLKHSSGFPFGTLAANLIGCALIGMTAAIFQNRDVYPDIAHHLILVGMLGGFTTFSSFSHESGQLIRHAQYGYAASYILGSIILGLSLSALTYMLFLKSGQSA